MKIVILNLILILFSSCLFRKTNKKQVINTETINTSYLLDPVSVKDTHIKNDTIINDEFVFDLLENNFNYNQICKTHIVINKKTTQNRYNQFIRDTISTLTNYIDTFIFYTTQKHSILMKANIESNNIILNKNIQIGCSMFLFENKFNFKLKYKSDKITIHDLESTSCFTFIFKKGRLSKITYEIMSYIE